MESSQVIEYKPLAPFEPEPWQREVLNDTSAVLLLTGTAGGGKSKVALEKLAALALHYPGLTILAGRKRREDADRSIVDVLEKDVLDVDNNPRVTIARKRFRFNFDNGSTIQWFGMHTEQDRKAIRSIGKHGAVDFAFMEEATEFDEEDFDELGLRVRGKKAGWNQLILATNPDADLHWINIRLIQGEEARVILSRASDNPHNAENYQERLDNTRGIVRARMRDGLWISGVGMVIDTWLDDWDHATGTYNVGNVRPEADYIPGGGPVVLAADDGYSGEYDPKTRRFSTKSNPRVFLLAQIRGDGQFAVFYESYQVKVKADDQLRSLKEHCDAMGWPFPRSVDYDKAAAHLEGIFTDWKFRYLRRSPANRDESIKLLRESVHRDVNGWAQIIVHPRCRHLRSEMSSWSYTVDGKPQAYGDHGPDALRYFNWNAIRGAGKPVDVATDVTDKEVLKRMETISDIYEKHMKLAAERLRV